MTTQQCDSRPRYSIHVNCDWQVDVSDIGWSWAMKWNIQSSGTPSIQQHLHLTHTWHCHVSIYPIMPHGYCTISTFLGTNLVCKNTDDTKIITISQFWFAPCMHWKRHIWENKFCNAVEKWQVLPESKFGKWFIVHDTKHRLWTRDATPQKEATWCTPAIHLCANSVTTSQ